MSSGATGIQERARQSSRKLSLGRILEANLTTPRSTIIEDRLEAMASIPDSVVAYVYIDYQNQSIQSSLRVLSSVLSQIVKALRIIPDIIKNAYKANQRTGRQLAVQEVQDLLRHVTNTVYIVIDAIDEFSVAERGALLAALRRLAMSPHFRLLFTGRPHVDVGHYFPCCSQVQVSANAADLQQYIQHEIRRQDVWHLDDNPFANTIVEELIAKSHGM